MVKYLIAALILGGVVIAPAKANFVSGDLDALNDQQVVLHEETGLEWLSLNKTMGMSINQALTNFASSGWRLAKHEEVVSLLSAAFDPVGAENTYYVGGKSVNPDFDIRLFGMKTSPWAAYTVYGMHGTQEQSYVSGWDSRIFLFGANNSTNGSSGQGLESSNPYYGVFLVSHVSNNISLSSRTDEAYTSNVPPLSDVPVSLGLLSFSLAALMRRKYK